MVLYRIYIVDFLEVFASRSYIRYNLFIYLFVYESESITDTNAKKDKSVAKYRWKRIATR